MSLRPALRPLAAVPRAAARRAASNQSSAADTHETFFNATWRNTFIVLGLGALVYPYLPSPAAGAASPSTSNAALEADAQGDKAPWITRLIARNMAGAADTWSERNIKHLELASEVADSKLLIGEAEMPKVHRMRFPSSFEMASPHSIAVGAQADLSDLKVKQDD